MTDPLGLKFGKIVGRFLANTADGVDSDDLPEFEPLSGTVTIKAEPPKILVPQGTPNPATVVQLPDHYICTLDNQGYLTNQGELGVKVIAPTPGTTNPDTFTYKAIFDLYYGTQRVKITPFSFYVTEYTPGPDSGDPDTGSVGLTDLTKVSPVPGSLGNAVTAGVSVVDVDVVGDALVFSLSDGSSLPPVTVPPLTAAIDAAESASASADAATAAKDAAEAAVNSFSIEAGTIVTGAPGDPASLTFFGGPPHWTVDGVLPKGDQGDPGPPAPDATSSVKGIIQLTGDLGGSAASPTVPGLAGKAPTVHTHTASQISDSTTTGRQLVTATDAAAARTAISAVSTSDSRLTDARTPTAAGQVYDFTIKSHTGARTAGAGNVIPEGVRIERNISIQAITILGGSAGTGNLVVEIRKNASGRADAGSATGMPSGVTIAAANHATDTVYTTGGPWAVAAGSRIVPYISTVDSPAGNDLQVSFKAVTT
ncbi:hypothetical protein [Nocardia africana]